MRWLFLYPVLLGALCLGSCDSGTTTTPKAGHDHDPDIVRVVGSSTIFPFAAKVAQEFQYKTGIGSVIEATGSGGGHKLFCQTGRGDSPDITASSRPQKLSEYKLCQSNYIGPIIEILVGFDGIVLAHSLEAADFELSSLQMFLAFAQHVPTGLENCRMIENPYEVWSDIDPALPRKPIEVYGPPPTSGTRDAFVEGIMEAGASDHPCLSGLERQAPGELQRIAHTIREDGRWIDAGENDTSLVQTLVNTPTALGLFGYQFLDQNPDRIKGVRINGAEPTFDNIADGSYPISRSLYLYAKADSLKARPALERFLLEFVSDEAAGPQGYLQDIGLVPPSPGQRNLMRTRITEKRAYQP